jgi:hypothetical protein
LCQSALHPGHTPVSKALRTATVALL